MKRSLSPEPDVVDAASLGMAPGALGVDLFSAPTAPLHRLPVPREEELRGPPPAFKRPVELAHYSMDAQRQVHLDDRSLVGVARM
jgi:hypothetical protein